MSALSDAAAVERPPAPPRTWSRERTIGVVLLALWAALGLGLLLFLINAWDPDIFSRYAPYYLSGLGVTVTLVGLSIVIGAVLSIPIAYARMSSNRLLSAFAYGYVYFFRGTPLIAQTFLIYYGLGQFREELQAVGLWAFFRDAWYCAVTAFSLNTAAYQAEILRGAIESVPRGQWEGAASLGLSKLQTLRKVILPQALIVALRPYGNEIVLMDQGLGDRCDHHRLRPDGRDPAGLFTHLRLSDIYLGGDNLPCDRGDAAAHRGLDRARPDTTPEALNSRDSERRHRWRKSHSSALGSWAIRWPAT
jgi:polar amino acid transport system permease protein